MQKRKGVLSKLDALSTLLTQYSIETMILIVVMLGVATKFIGELIEWFYTKLRKYFNHQNDKDKAHSEITNGLLEIKEVIDQLMEKSEKLNTRVDCLEKQVVLTTERLQENSKSYIIDKHHYFFYQVGAIDDLNLQSLERRYLYYKSAGGDSYIDNLMEEIRELPKLNLQNQNIVSAIHSAREQ